MNQDITFISDGGDTVRDLQMYLSPQAEHILDWFHITMRVTVLRQMAKGFQKIKEFDNLDKNLGRIKWFVWNGNVYMALQALNDLEDDLEDYRYENESDKKLNKLYEYVQNSICVRN